jgi:hypothetical protein
MPSYPSVDKCKARLHLHGWSVGEACFGSTWQVDGSKGESRILAQGRTQGEAWWRACVQAREVDMLAPVREGSGDG